MKMIKEVCSGAIAGVLILMIVGAAFGFAIPPLGYAFRSWDAYWSRR